MKPQHMYSFSFRMRSLTCNVTVLGKTIGHKTCSRCSSVPVSGPRKRSETNSLIEFVLSYAVIKSL
jgi:hypothetical protein